jgi:two-component system sensor histidine kinase MprB
VTRPPAVLGRGIRRLENRWRDLPLRTRLTTAAALAATIAITAVVGVAYIAVRHELRVQIDSNLRQQAADAHLVVQPDGSGGYTVNLDRSVGEIRGYLQVLDVQGHVDTSGPEDPVIPITSHDRRIASHGGVWFRDRRINGIHMRLITARSRIPDVAVLVAVPMTGVDRQLHTLAIAFVFLALGGLVLTAFLCWAAVRRVTRPVRTLTETAETIAATRDLTLRIKTEGDGDDELGRLGATFNTMLDALEQSLAAQRQLVTDASHELRTPLASLRTNVEVLNHVERLSPEQRRAVLDGILTQLDELTGLVADVVELARGEAPPSDHQEIALDELVTHAVERAQRHWPTVRFRVATEPAAVRGVPARLDRAVANLLDNAAKFSPADGTVGVTVTSDGMVTVADEGPGIPESALPHVFDRFFRADEARALPGSGLGLAIVQQIALGHGGRITLANRSDGGAVATMHLPTAAEEDSATAAGPAEPPARVRAGAPDAGASDAGASDAEPSDAGGVPMPVEESLFR